MSEIRPNIIRDIGLRLYKYFPNIETLTVSTDVKIEELSQVLLLCTKLKTLDLSTITLIDNYGSPQTVTPITGLTALESLSVSTTEPFRVPCVQLFLKSTTLTELNITHISHYQKTLNYWFETANFWTIMLKKLQIRGDASMAFCHISSLSTLETLRLDTAEIQEKSLTAVLHDLPSLRSLSIINHHSKVSHQFLHSCPSLKSFEFIATITSPLFFLNNLTSLTSLKLDMRNISFGDLVPLPTLEELSITSSEVLDYSPLAVLTPHLKYLSILTPFSSSDGIILPVLESLETLEAYNSILDMDLIDHFPKLREKKLPIIEYFNTPEQNTPDIDDFYSDGSWSE
jgi:hypothetical protein